MGCELRGGNWRGIGADITNSYLLSVSCKLKLRYIQQKEDERNVDKIRPHRNMYCNSYHWIWGGRFVAIGINLVDVFNLKIIYGNDISVV
jgi:hypothetical protein